VGLEPQNHPILGKLVKDGDFSWWLSQIEFLGQHVDFSLQTESSLSQDLIDRAAQFVSGLKSEETEYKKRIADDIMSYDGESAVIRNLSLEDVQGKMALEYIGYSEKDNFQLSYSDGGIFGGHMMVGHFDSTGQLKSSEIAG
jgi:hypothetical protein